MLGLFSVNSLPEYVFVGVMEFGGEGAGGFGQEFAVVLAAEPLGCGDEFGWCSRCYQQQVSNVQDNLDSEMEVPAYKASANGIFDKELEDELMKFTAKPDDKGVQGPLVKKLESLAQKYDRELEAHNKLKQIQLEGPTLIDGVKSVPFSRTNAVNDLFKRKKRRMAEATKDVAEYMSCHNLFSDYENKKNPTEGGSISNFPKISGTFCAEKCNKKFTKYARRKVNSDDEFWATTDDLSSFIAGDGDDGFEDMLRKIEFLQSQAGQLRIRVDKVMNDNADKIFFSDKLSLRMPFEASSANNDDRDGMAVGTYIASQLICIYVFVVNSG
ncbi:hypothetical protein CASFOL_013607 [Castilleja foliolosa]|uniref:Uncharacterized protein n=1 Tax=Castilleja foliolosa TaxID=1961234 RepID=A0ABD3DL50_9LAMI